MMVGVSFIKLEVDILKSMGSKLNTQINNMYKNQLIIGGINEFFIAEFDDNECEDIIKSNLKAVCEGIQNINTTKIMPNIESVIISTIDLTMVEKNYIHSEKTSKLIDNISQKILKEIFSFDNSEYETYKKSIAEDKIINEIPNLLLDIRENQGFKQYVKPMSEVLISLNQKKKDGVLDIQLDFFDYENKEFEKELINELDNQEYIIISGPSGDEALFYSGYILQKNQVSNVFVVDSVENWNLIQGIQHTEYYKNVVFIARFGEDIEPIPHSTTIILVDNNSCQRQQEGILRFEKRRKDITVEKLQKLLPMTDNLTYEKGKYNANDIHRMVTESYNEYSIYKKVILKSVHEVKCYKLTKDEALLSLIGSFMRDKASRDYNTIIQYFPEVIKLLEQKLPLKTLNLSGHFIVLDRDKIVRDILNLHVLHEKDFANFVSFAVDTYFAYFTVKISEARFFIDYQQISSSLYGAISTTCMLLIKNGDYHKISQKIYEGVIKKIDDVQVQSRVKIILFQELLKYDIEYLIKELNDLFTNDEINILNQNIPGNMLSDRDYGEELLSTLERLLYSEEYSIEIPEIILRGIEVVTNKRTKDKYIAALRRYFTYVINDYPVSDEEKLSYLKQQSLVTKSILKYVVNTEYKGGSWIVNEVKEEFGYIQEKRERLVVDRRRYTFAIQDIYMNQIEEKKLDVFVDDFNIYTLNYEDNNLLEQIGKSTFSDSSIVGALLKLRRRLSLEMKWDRLEKNDLLFVNGFKLIKELEQKLSNSFLKECYALETYHDQTLLLTIDLLGDQSLENSNEIIENKRKELLKIDKQSVKELVQLYMQNKTEWIDSIEFVIDAMVYANIKFEEAVELFGYKNDSSSQITSLFARHSKFGISSTDVYDYVVNNTKLDMDKAYYLQHVNFPLKTLEKFEETGRDISIALKYYSVYKLDKIDMPAYYKLLKEAAVISNCVEILIDRGERLNSYNEFNIIKEAVDLFSIKNVVGVRTREYDIKQLYDQCIEYYERHKTNDNLEALRYLSIMLIQVIEDSDFLAHQLFEDVDFLIQILAVAYPVQFESKLTEMQQENQATLLFALLQMDMNCIDVVEFSQWVNDIVIDSNDKPFKDAIISFTSSLCGKYFATNSDLLKLLDKKVIRDKEFQQGFVISYSNTVGVTTSEINAVSAIYTNRKTMLEELKGSYTDNSLKSHKKLIDKMLNSINSSIYHFEELGRN